MSILKYDTRDGHKTFSSGKLRYYAYPPVTREIIDSLPHPDELFLDLLKQRVKENKRVGTVTIYKTVNGKTYSFSQKQTRSVTVTVRQVDG